MRTRAYKEDVATRPRSAREFAKQTLCSMGGFIEQKKHVDMKKVAIKRMQY